MTAAPASPAAEDLVAITEDAWAALLGEDGTLVPHAAPAHDAPGTAAWSATTTVGGAWHGVVTVELAEVLARRLAGRMLALPVDETARDSDVADAVGELVNLVGGGVKSLMPGPSALSLPAVASGPARHAHGGVLVRRADLAWQAAPLRVFVHVPEEGPR